MHKVLDSIWILIFPLWQYTIKTHIVQYRQYSIPHYRYRSIRNYTESRATQRFYKFSYTCVVVSARFAIICDDFILLCFGPQCGTTYIGVRIPRIQRTAISVFYIVCPRPRSLFTELYALIFTIKTTRPAMIRARSFAARRQNRDIL